MNSFLNIYILIFQVSFTIHPENPGRIVTLVTITLILTNMFTTIKSSSPTVNANTVSSIGIWLIFCLIFVIICLVEYGIIQYLKYLSSKCYSEEQSLIMSRRIDRISFFISPFIIAAFIITYWLLYF